MRIEQVWTSVGVTMVACAATVSAQCTYSVQSTPNWHCAIEFHRIYIGTGLNNLGAWCGYRSMCYPEEGEGYFPIYCPPNGTPQILPMPPSAGPKGAQATAVNDAGVVVGFSFQGLNGNEEIGCIWWPDGTITEIAPAPGGTSSRAMDINNSNVVVGQTGNKPYVLSQGVMTVIDPSPLPGGVGRKVSDSGWVGGIGGDTTGTNGRAFRWIAGVLEILPPLNGNQTSEMLDINNSGIVVGISRRYVIGTGYISEPCVWRHEGAEVLPPPTGYSMGWAMAINDLGVVAGRAIPTPESELPSLPIIWTDSGVLSLQSLVPPGFVVPSVPWALNATGQMIFQGSAKLLTPMSASLEDLNGDCAVDGSDIAKLLAEWGQRDWSVADIDGDGLVNGFDLALMLGAWTGSK